MPVFFKSFILKKWIKTSHSSNPQVMKALGRENTIMSTIKTFMKQNRGPTSHTTAMTTKLRIPQNTLDFMK
jgi:hypothetical protein